MDEKDNTGNSADWHRYFQPLVLVLLSGLLALSIPLESKRPSVEKAVASMPGIQLNARLWMDPFEVPQRDQEHKHITRFDDLGGQILSHIEKNCSGKPKVRFIAVMVDGGPYFESIERRRRIRYAIISSLIAQGYHAEDRDHIRYFGHLPEPWRYYDPQNENRVMSTAERQMPEIVPYEWFQSDQENSPSIALLWINESQIATRPLSKLWVIKNELQLAGLSAIKNNLVTVNSCQVVNPSKSGELTPQADKFIDTQDSYASYGREIPPKNIKIREITLDSACIQSTSNGVSSESFIISKEWEAVFKAEYVLRSSYHNTVGLNEVVTELKKISERGNSGGQLQESASHESLASYILSENSFLLQQLGPKRSARLLDCLASQIANRHGTELLSDAYDFMVLGPASSDGLSAMLQDPLIDKDLTCPIQSKNQIMQIYSPVASIEAGDLINESGAKNILNDTNGNNFETNKCLSKDADIIKYWFARAGFPLFRTNPTDDKVIDSLKEELKLRGISPSTKDGQLVILAEADTMYGRTLANLVRHDPDFGTINKKIFNYFRGLDGEGANKSKSTEYRNNEKGSQPNASDSLDDFVQTVQPKSFEFAWGDDQFDYLRRIADLIENTDKGKVRAVGLLGSDVYDKLLILKALKPRFPGAIFFTTDLDARFFDGTIEPEFSRNMIVASGFGIQANSSSGDIKPPSCTNQNFDKDETCFNTTPPFRSSAQTAYFRTLSQMLKQDDINDKDIEIYEIGRTRAIRIDTDQAVNKHSPLGRYYALGLLTLAFVIAASLLCPKVNSIPLRDLLFKAAGWLLLPMALIGMLGYFAYRSDEPFTTPLEGISLWPTEFIRLIAVLLGSYFWYRAWAHPCTDSQSESKDRIKVRDWLLNVAILFGLLFVFLLLVQILGEVHPQSIPVIPLLSIVLAMLSGKLLAEKTENTTSENKANTHDKNRNLLHDTYVFALLISAISMSLILFSSPPFVPYRGQLSKWADRLILGMAVSVFVCLLATVLANGVNLIKRIKQISLYTSKISESTNIADIAEDTRKYFGIVWYPFIIATIMLLSRSTIFDNWPMPVGLAVVFLLSFSLLIGIVVRIRYLAEQTRLRVLKSMPLENKHEIEAIKNINQGAYGPLLTGPSIGGLALLAGGSTLPDLVAKLTGWLFG